MSPRADLILANRSYLDHDSPTGEPEQGSLPEGGLLAALRPATAPWSESGGTTWLGASRGEFDRDHTDSAGYEFVSTPAGPLRHRRLWFDGPAWQGHYTMVANGFFWPLLHLVRLPLPEMTGYFPRPEPPGTAEWAAYEQVNAAFAAAAMEETAARNCWVHDYQLALVPAMLREAAFGRPVGFFLHTAFPDLGLVLRVCGDSVLPHLRAFVEGILGADLAGFQSDGDLRRFHAAAAALCGASGAAGGLRFRGRFVRTGSFPVGINAEEVSSLARHAHLPSEAAPAAATGLPLVVGLERCDFTKGIPERLGAIARAANSGVRFAYVGIAAPTREDVRGYAELERAVEAAARSAASAVAAAGGYFLQVRRAIPWSEVVGLQRHAGVVFTSSLADGMNLVPLQAAVAQSLRPNAERAVVLVGRDAGAAHAYPGFEQDGLVTVDPFDEPATAATLTAAVEGRIPGASDGLIAAVRDHSAASWATAFLSALESAAC